MCFPPATLMVPSALTVSEWHEAQLAAVTGAVSAWWPVGGIP